MGFFSPQKYVGMDGQGLLVCPDCQTGMDWVVRDKTARCHDCKQVFPVSPGWADIQRDLLIDDLLRDVRALRFELAEIRARLGPEGEKKV